ncbi:MAG: glycine zipper 2TM domain-containing protein [Sphingomonas sp.]
MKIKILCGAAVVALLSCAPVSAQRAQDWRADSSASWNRDDFWRGAPDAPLQRVNFLQQRINRSIADRSLDRREARRVQYQLNSIRQDASGRRMTPQRRDMLNQRLDQLAQQIRWARNDGRPGYGGGQVATRDDDRRFETTYDARRYYRDGPQYQERRLSAQDEVYRGSDGRYYCKRNDGTTGLVIGAIGGGVVGNVIDGGHNRVAGTLIGGVLGALAGKAIDQSNSDVRCR